MIKKNDFAVTRYNSFAYAGTVEIYSDLRGLWGATPLDSRFLSDN